MSTRTHIKRACLTFLACLGYLCLLPLWRRLRVRRGWETYRILTYHSVNGDRPHETDIAPDVFERQMAFLARACTPVALADAIEDRLPERGTGPCVVITLDDGYADNLTQAAPILERHGIPATCFLTAKHVDSRELMPHDAGCTPAQAGLLTWGQVLELHRAGIAIGSHAMTHARLGQRAAEEIAWQLRESKQLIERHLGAAVTLLTYPYGRHGDYNHTVIQAARDAGYHAAATAQHGWNAPHSDRYRLKRMGIDAADTLFTLRARLNGALDLLTLLEGPVMRRVVGGVNAALTPNCRRHVKTS